MNMIQPLLSAVGPQAWGALAGTLNETPEHTRQGLADALPMFFAGLIGKGSTTTGAANLLSLIRSSDFDIERVGGTSGGGAITPNLFRDGGAIAQSVLGERYNSAASAIATHAGVGLNSAQSLLGLAAPLALGGIARAAPKTGFTPEGLMRFLQSQRDDVVAAIPAGLNLNRVFDRPSATHTTHQTRQVRHEGGGVWPWILGIGGATVLALALGQCMARAPTPPAPVAVEAPRVAPPQQSSVRIDLPGGVAITAPLGSIGHNLASYLSSNAPAPRTFTFNNLNFDSGDVLVTPESTATLDAIGQVLRAYPNVTVRLEGHTDNVGDRDANMNLSLARANSVARGLIQRGVNPTQVSASGFGPDRPIRSNDTEEGRANNRRLELTVTRK